MMKLWEIETEWGWGWSVGILYCLYHLYVNLKVSKTERLFPKQNRKIKHLGEVQVCILGLTCTVSVTKVNYLNLTQSVSSFRIWDGFTTYSSKVVMKIK